MHIFISFQIACPSVKETVEGADILVFVLPHQVRFTNVWSINAHFKMLQFSCFHRKKKSHAKIEGTKGYLNNVLLIIT